MQGDGKLTSKPLPQIHTHTLCGWDFSLFQALSYKTDPTSPPKVSVRLGFHSWNMETLKFLAKSAVNSNECLSYFIQHFSVFVVGAFRFSGLLYCPAMKVKVIFFDLPLYSQLQDKCCSVPEPMKCFPTGKPRTPPAPLPTQTTSDQTCYAKDVRPKMNNRHRFPPPSENSTKQAAHGTNSTLTLPLKPEHKRRGPSAARHEAAYDVLRRCSLCGILLPLPILNQHQVPSLCSLLTQPVVRRGQHRLLFLMEQQAGVLLLSHRWGY